MKLPRKHTFYHGLIALLFISPGALLPESGHAIDSNNIFSLGVEGFHDRYTEPQLGVHEDSNYGSVTGSYTHNENVGFFALDGRASYGKDDYSSADGTINGIPQLEFEGRIRGGFNFTAMEGTFSPYLGFGVRYFEDENKGNVTSLGYYGYDRRILQLYIPVGVTYTYVTPGGWAFAPNAEVDPLLWGNVNTRLESFPGYPNIDNTQQRGVGLRGEFMVGRDEGAYAWQIGPFVRYWNMSDSVPYTGDGLIAYEPHNERLQIGAALRFLW